MKGFIFVSILVFDLVLVSFQQGQQPPPPPTTTTTTTTTPKTTTTSTSTTTKSTSTASTTSSTTSSTTTTSTTTKSTSTASTTTTSTSTASSVPLIKNWVESTGGTYDGSYTDVTGIYYDSNYVYITANGLPDYTIGPWNDNPNSATGQSYSFQITRNPKQNTGTKTVTQMGAIGFWKNGLPIYNAEDGYSYNSLGYWNRNAGAIEYVSFDDCGGHPTNLGQYHNHVNPVCLYSYNSSSSHSPIIGWAFDGYPVYGPFGYTSANDSSSAIKRMMTGYSLRDITTRTSYWNGTELTSAEYGPAVSSTYYLGYFIEDYGYSSSGADLDEYNGRWCVTPDYPSGIYAYFVPTTSAGEYTFPYSLATYYYGVVGTTWTNITIPSTATTYFSYT
jgi:hypothetical protein